MPERTMTAQETEAYLDETHVANLVTLNPDGSPHVAPVWYVHRQGRLHISAGASAVKVRNIRRDARVAVSIANDSSPATYVLVEGQARVTSDDAAELLVEMYVRYQGEERGTLSAQKTAVAGPSVAVHIEPSKIITWVSDPDD